MLPITYDYRMYRNGVYLGSLPTPSSPFTYSLDINSGSAPMNVIVPLPVVTAQLPPEFIQAEDSSILQAEDGTNLELESTPSLYGTSTSGALIANDNDIIVYEFSPDYPSGKKVYSGWITKWKKQTKAGQVNINCISYGMDLNDYVVQTGIAYTAQITQGTAGSNSDAAVGNAGGGNYMWAQTFTPLSNYSIGKIKVGIAGAFSTNLRLRLSLYQGSPAGTANVLLAQSALVSQNTLTATTYDFIFSSPAAVLSAGSYFWQLDSPDVASIGDTVYISDVYSNPYAGGYSSQFSGGSWHDIATVDAEFTIYSVDANVVSPYSSVDPTTIYKSVIDDYHNRGGKVNYGVGTTDLTGLSVSYTFNFARTLAAVGKAFDLAPADWYWTVDPANSTGYFKQFHTTADILLVLGQNINDLELGLNAESVRNILYFTGGATAGVNLFRKYTNATSLAAVGRPRLEDQTDNRVTLNATADALADAFLDSVASEVYETVVSIPRGTGIDITTILCGKSIGFSGFGTFEDALVLNIVRIQRYSDRIDCTLGSIPPRASSILKDLQNSVGDLQTIANPSAPS